MKQLRFLDLFSGIGGFRLGMEQAGHKCVGYVEWDKFARKSYEAMHNTKGEWTAHDITKVTDEELWELAKLGIDVIVGGFPCQAFSVAGLRGGFEDTRGTMFFEIARFAKQIKPRILLLENVKGLLSHDKGKTFGVVLNTLDELGYDVEWQVLNSKDFGVPHNRERVFIIAHLRGASRREVFPICGTSQATNVPVKLVAHRKNYRRNTQTFSPEGIVETLDTGQGGGRGHYVQVRAVSTPERGVKHQNGRRFKEHEEPMFTLTAQDRHGIAITEPTKQGYAMAYVGDAINYQAPTSKTRRGRVGRGVANTLDCGCKQGVLLEDFRIRKLTPKECYRLQAFPDSLFEKAKEVNSNSQLYKQAGNTVTVSVVYEIAKRL